MKQKWSGWLWASAFVLALVAIWWRSGENWRRWEGKQPPGEVELVVTPL